MIQGIIVHFDAAREFGFIRSPAAGGADIFFHVSDITSGSVALGARVSCEVVQAEQGYRAVNLVIRPPATDPHIVFGAAALLLAAAIAFGFQWILPHHPIHHYLLIGINLSAAALAVFDKSIAGRSATRVPEKVLLGVAALGGSLGLLLAMTFFRHKTAKPSFMFAAGAIFCVQLLIWFKVLPLLH